MQKGTGQQDRGKATAIAVTLESTAAEAKAGRMTRAKATGIVSAILKLAGCETIEVAPSLAEVAQMLLAGDLSDGTHRKYKSIWKGLATWAGSKAELPVDSWTLADCERYYAHLTKTKSSTSTANDHLRFLTMVFERAVKKGYRANNPCRALDKRDNDIVEREAITRVMTARTLRACRRGQRKDWAVGWVLSILQELHA